MQNRFSYKKKYVHDINIENSFVRLWHHGGDFNRTSIKKIFQRCLKTAPVWPYAALMPDFHQSGETMVGSVIPTQSMIMPELIGNDIGCGMLAVKLPVLFQDIMHWEKILNELKRAIPVGTAQNREVNDRVVKNPLWDSVACLSAIQKNDLGKLYRQFGTLGGGNHFAEILRDHENHLWVIIHTGSRYAGELVRKDYAESNSLIQDSQIANAYMTDHDFALGFAKENRLEILRRILSVLFRNTEFDEEQLFQHAVSNYFDVIHNAVTVENHFGEDLIIHRKGAVRILQGDIAVIPGSMGSGSYIVEGRGNPFSFHSCSHGAGRKLSRKEAIHSVTSKDFKRQMAGIVYDTSMNLRDEAPGAYKAIKQVLKGQKDIVKILFDLTPVLSLKG